MRNILQGRDLEISELREKLKSRKSELVVIYGRRRVGKSAIIRAFLQSLKRERASTEKTSKTTNKNSQSAGPLCLTFEGLEKQRTPIQIKHFTDQLRAQVDDPLLKQAQFQDWSQLFEYLTHLSAQKKEKSVIAFDEFQWMAAAQTKLVSLIKYYWDNYWQQNNMILILCGSIASFMVKKVIRSKALYGRITLELPVRKLSVSNCKHFFPKSKSDEEILKSIMVYGGVPKYLLDLSPSSSFEQNLEKLFFRVNSLYLEEYEKIFSVHFKEPQTYLHIIKILQKKPLTLAEISQAIRMKSSGGVKAYLENLELAEFIRPNYCYQNNSTKKMQYRVSDEFLNFYTHFVLPNMNIIKAGGGRGIVNGRLRTQLNGWLGLAFENYVLNNAIYFANLMGFGDLVESFGSYRSRESGVQVDLIYSRSDRTTSICEMKFSMTPISTEVIREFQIKLSKIPNRSKYSIQKILIAPNGVSSALAVSGYFDIILTNSQIFR